MTIKAKPAPHCTNARHWAVWTGSLIHLFCGICRGYVTSYVFPANEIDAALGD